MNYDQTRYPRIREYFSKELTTVDTENLIRNCESKFDEYLEEADFRDNDMIKAHMTMSILPLIAVYKTLRETRLTEEEAYKHCYNLSQIYAGEVREDNKKIGNNPLGFFLFRLACKKVMKTNFPKEGWKIEWKQKNSKEVEFHMHSCIYSEMTIKYDCPELCTVFCKNDITTFEGFEPAFYFSRTGTIAEGCSVCDFHMTKGKK